MSVCREDSQNAGRSFVNLGMCGVLVINVPVLAVVEWLARRTPGFKKRE